MRGADILDIIIVGGGAAGLATAIFARRAAPSLAVTVLEGARRPGAKILVSGGSRCNVTNTEVTERDFWGGRSTIVRQVLRAFGAADAAAFFAELGVALHEEADGKLFPDSNRSRDVLDALLREAASRGVSLLTNQRVTGVERDERDGGGFRVLTANGDRRARCVVLATGGQSLPKSGSDGAGYGFAGGLGHTIVAATPALTPLRLDEASSIHRALAGVTDQVEIAIWRAGRIDARLRGSIVWTHFGISGPAAMNASRHWLRASLEQADARATMSFCPGLSFADVDSRLVRAALESPRASVGTALSSLVPASVAAAILGSLGVDSSTTLAHLSRHDRRHLARALVEWPLPVAGTRGYNEAEATAGGVALDEIDPRTMESRVCQGLFLVGEVLDVDGRIGGFNFQWAWSTAFVAARGLVLRCVPS